MNLYYMFTKNLTDEEQNICLTYLDNEVKSIFPSKLFAECLCKYHNISQEDLEYFLTQVKAYDKDRACHCCGKYHSVNPVTDPTTLKGELCLECDEFACQYPF